MVSCKKQKADDDADQPSIPSLPAHQQLLLWQLSDSALPTGGFVASGGLEAACQTGFVTDLNTLVVFLKTAVHSYAHTTLPYVKACHKVVAEFVTLEGVPDPSVELEKTLEKLTELDTLYHVSTLNVITRRASKAQGVALLMLYDRSFHPDALPEPVLDNCPNSPSLVSAYKLLIRRGRTQGHLPICFPVLLASLGVELESTLRLHLYQFLRAGISAAVRLNLVGPYQAQTVTCQLYPLIESLLSDRVLLNTPPEFASQTSPTLDVVQGLHDNLYSRIFNS